MTYKTRQEVLRAAADWMDVCEEAGVEAMCRCDGTIRPCNSQAFYDKYNYEFPLALLEGKEVWVGSELWNVPNNFKFIANSTDFLLERRRILDGKGKCGWIKDCSWNQPKPKTVMVPLLVEDAEWIASFNAASGGHLTSAGISCKKALEKL